VLRRDPTAGWGPSHQDARPRRRQLAVLLGLGALAVELAGHGLLSQGLVGALRSTVDVIFRAGLALTVLALVLVVLPGLLGRRRSQFGGDAGRRLAAAGDPALAVREHSRALGGGAFLGLARDSSWVTAAPEHAVLVLGPPRAGKTSSIVIPALLAAPGAAVCTSTKPDVLRASAATRAQLGQVWLFDPVLGVSDELAGVRRLRWSPLAGAVDWDSALLMSRAMTAAAAPGAGTMNESHWRERSAALLAPLLLAAQLGGHDVGELLRWVLRGELKAAAEVLEEREQGVAGDVLAGIARTDTRERSSIFSACAGVLAAYNSDGARRAAGNPNFDAERFVAGSDTIYIAAPAHAQALCAPLVIGLLENIRRAAYARARSGAGGAAPVFLCLDELANIAPIHDLPALVSEAGGQGLHVLACLQDLSQARSRWGDAAADGLLSLFQTKLVLDGIADSRTLEALSLALGEYDRRVVSRTRGHTRGDLFSTGPDSGSSWSVSTSTVRQRVLSPGDIAQLPSGHGLLLEGARWRLVELSPWHSCEPWRTLAGDEPAPTRAPRAQALGGSGERQDARAEAYTPAPERDVDTHAPFENAGSDEANVQADRSQP
jgi:type IV secretory pathway TraG/TraD family ATPase VirD4